MTRYGLVLGLAALVGLSAWGFARGTDASTARAAEPAAVTVEVADDDSTHDAAVRRYRTNQSHHWRHVMIGTR